MNSPTLEVHLILSLHFKMKDKVKFSKALGKKIKALRLSKNKSLKEIEAIDPSIDRSNLSKIENGTLVPTVYTLYKITKLLEITLSEVFEGLE